MAWAAIEECTLQVAGFRRFLFAPDTEEGRGAGRRCFRLQLSLLGTVPVSPA